jgi:hypothetical protein
MDVVSNPLVDLIYQKEMTFVTDMNLAWKMFRRMEAIRLQDSEKFRKMHPMYYKNRQKKGGQGSASANSGNYITGVTVNTSNDTATTVSITQETLPTPPTVAHTHPLN